MQQVSTSKVQMRDIFGFASNSPLVDTLETWTAGSSLLTQLDNITIFTQRPNGTPRIAWLGKNTITNSLLSNGEKNQRLEDFNSQNSDYEDEVLEYYLKAFEGQPSFCFIDGSMINSNGDLYSGTYWRCLLPSTYFNKKVVISATYPVEISMVGSTLDEADHQNHYMRYTRQ